MGATTVPTIPYGAHVVLRDHEENLKVFRLPTSAAASQSEEREKPAALHMGKYKPIPISLIASVPYGATLRLAESGCWERYRQSMAEPEDDETAQGGEVYETNAHLAQDNSAQALTPGEITTIKSTHDGEEVIAALVTGSATFASKTRFAKEKYLNKKRKKHIQQVTCLQPTLFELCETYMKQSRQKICGLRFDYLSSILCQADVRTGGRYLVVDCACGLVAGAVAQQLAGDGRVYRLYTRGASDKAITELDLGEARQVVKAIPLDVLQADDPEKHNWVKMPDKTTAPEPEMDAEQSGEGKHDDDAQRLARHEQRVERVKARKVDLDDLRHGNWMDAVILVAGEEDEDLAQGALQWGLKQLTPGGRVVVYAQHLQPLASKQGEWRNSAEFVDVRMVQLFTREYQVLPQRTHPHMTADAQLCEGFLLMATRVVALDDELAATQPTDNAESSTPGKSKGKGGGGGPRKRRRCD